MLMFHDVVRGQNYTGFTHRYQPQLEMSSHIRQGQAILIGRCDQAGSKLSVSLASDALASGSSAATSANPPLEVKLGNSSTFYRFVLPVSRERAPSTSP